MGGKEPSQVTLDTSGERHVVRLLTREGREMWITTTSNVEARDVFDTLNHCRDLAAAFRLQRIEARRQMHAALRELDKEEP